MQSVKKTPQYAVVAKEAYLLIVQEGKTFEDAWDISAQKNTTKDSIRYKGCPKHAFLGLCESGNLTNIPATKTSDNINYRYAKYALTECHKYPALSTSQIWEKLKQHFPNGSSRHNCQLHVVKGVWDYLVHLTIQ